MHVANPNIHGAIKTSNVTFIYLFILKKKEIEFLENNYAYTSPPSTFYDYDYSSQTLLLLS
jgi:hypothetical protein